jgi:GlcNAc-PI de-N-acetylase
MRSGRRSGLSAVRRGAVLVLGVTALLAAPGTAGSARAMSASDCSAGTVVNVVAHEDDDLLFLSPDLLHDIDAGMCVTTVYLTAGDARSTLEGGSSPGAQVYWRDGRETGALAAYARMGGASWGWYETDPGVPGRAVQAVDNTENPRLRLVFLRLKDGLRGDDLTGGQGTPVKTLWKTWNEQSDITSLVDDQHPERGIETYDRQQLIDTLGTLYQQAPNLVEIKTLDPREEHLTPVVENNDHPDHVAAAKFAVAARDQHAPDVPILGYQGYINHGHNLPDNVTGDDYNRKYATFYTYGQHDVGVCDRFDLDDPCLAGFGDFYQKLLSTQYPVQ